MKELTRKILDTTNNSNYGWLVIDSSESKDIQKLLKNNIIKDNPLD